MPNRGAGRQNAAFAAGALLLAGATPAYAAPAESRVPEAQTQVEALAQDAAEYSRRHDVPLNEAMRRLAAQEETVPLTDGLRATYAARLAGISVEHRPDYRIVVLLTGDEPVAGFTVAAGGLTVPIVFRTGAAATSEAVVAAIRAHQAGIRSRLKVAPGMGLDPRTGELVLVVHARDLAERAAETLEAEFEALTGVPVRVRPQGREHRDAVAGGAGLEAGGRDACTTGFVVSDGRRRGVVTAAHCPDALIYRGPEGAEVPLAFVGQWGWSYQDVQIHETDRAERPLFYAGADRKAARRLLSWRARTSTRAGDNVCHKGETSGYSCSDVELTDYAPPGDLCGGPCAPSWVTVRGPSCKGGDSGGPVFSGSTAFGILKGASYAGSGRCDFYYYMSTDYLPEGWSLLR